MALIATGAGPVQAADIVSRPSHADGGVSTMKAARMGGLGAPRIPGALGLRSNQRPHRLIGLQKPLAVNERRVCPDRAGQASCQAIQAYVIASGTGYAPLDLQVAYNLPSSSTAGTGVTVALINAFDDPNAEQDLATYRSHYGLAACTSANGCFRKVNQTGGTTYPPPDANWAFEESIDLDIVSALCPSCHLLLVEANSANLSDLGPAVQEAATLKASVISNSYSTTEFSGESAYDIYYNQSGAGATVVAAAADTGNQTVYPAASPYVVAVGGTTLTSASNARGWSETVWRSTGSGCSLYESKPAWQTDAGCTHRTLNDISAVADPTTPVAVYDTYGGQPGWTSVGGNSASTPVIAAGFALSGNPAVFKAGAQALYSKPYGFPAYVTDITQGSDGTCGSYLCTAQPGYDGPSGVGVLSGVPPDPATASLNGPQGTALLGAANVAFAPPPPVCPCDPVNTATGNLFETATDLKIPGRGRNLDFTRTYNAQAAVTQTSSGALGYGWTDSYAAYAVINGTTGNVTVQQGNGSTVDFTNASGTYSAAPWVLARLTKSGDGSYTFLLPDQTSDRFNSAGQLISQSDRNGYVTSLSYSGSLLATVQDPAGRKLTFTHDGLNRITKVTDPSRSVRYAYDANGNLSTVTDPAGKVTTFGYDASHRLTSIKRPAGGLTTNTYDTSNRLSTQTNSLNHKITLSYATGQTTVTDANGNVTVYTYQNNVLTSVTHGSGTSSSAIWTLSYDQTYEVTQATDPNTHSRHMIGDGRGNVVTLTDALGRVTSYAYDSLNDVTSVTDPLGNVTTYSYESHGDLTKVARPSSVTTSFAYGDTTHPGDVTSMTDPDGQLWSFTYDSDGDLTRSVDPLQHASTAAYNTIGWRTSMVLPNGNVSGGNPSAHTVSFSYDNDGYLTVVTDPLGHTTKFAYDADHNLASLTDADQNATSYVYDLADELTKVTRADLTTLGNGYDNDGNLTSQTDGAGNATSYAYDALNRVHSVTDPLQRATSYGYDGAGNRTNLTDPSNNVTSFGYDAANELAGVSYSDGKTPNVSLTYDADGHRSKMTDGTGTTSYYYDALGRLIDVQNGAGLWVTYVYDAKSQVTELDYPYVNVVVKRTFDNAGHLASVSDWAPNTSRFGYDADGNLTTETLPNSTTNTYTYDAADRLMGINDLQGSSSFLKFAYGRDNLGLLTSSVATGVIQGNQTFTYTPLNQLKQDNGFNYAYDKADNLTAMVTGLSLTYDVANELTKTTQGTSTTTYAADARGNRISASGGTNATYGYDQANRLTSLGAVTYKYDRDGVRMQTVNGGTTRSFSWDQVEGVPLLLSEGQNIYLEGPGGQLLEQVSTSGTPYWYHRDQQGSVSALTGPTGAYAGGYSYGPYGETPQSTVPASILNPFQYAGEYVDAESGLAYLRARFYDPATGQFLNRDPITPLSRQAYSYAGGSPLNLRDPAGLDPQIPGQQSTPQGGGAPPGDCPACDILQQVGTPSEPPNGGSGSTLCGDPTVKTPSLGTAAEGLPSLLRAGGEGAAPRLAMNMDTVSTVAEKYGIDISDSSIAINKAIAGARGSTAPDLSITLYRGAFESEEQLAKTLVHEQYHVGQLQAGMEYPEFYDPNSAWEREAEQFANDWWDNR